MMAVECSRRLVPIQAVHDGLLMSTCWKVTIGTTESKSSLLPDLTVTNELMVLRNLKLHARNDDDQ